MSEIVKNLWETDALCKSCGKPMRSQGYVWVDEHTFYFNLKCGYCGKRLRGKKKSVEPYIVDWSGWEDLKIRTASGKPLEKRYMTAKRRKKDGSL